MHYRLGPLPDLILDTLAHRRLLLLSLCRLASICFKSSLDLEWKRATSDGRVQADNPFRWTWPPRKLSGECDGCALIQRTVPLTRCSATLLREPSNRDGLAGSKCSTANPRCAVLELAKFSADILHFSMLFATFIHRFNHSY